VGIGDFDDTDIKRLIEWSKGAAVAAAAPLELNAWADREIEESKDWRMIAHEVSSVYPARGRREPVAGEAPR
jgi:predicted GNAT superfamily acetyltransferase